tara:strand:- start:5918 stop:6973 length:1056 start_codon:yes stop_codon:yes gene_type:complete
VSVLGSGSGLGLLHQIITKQNLIIMKAIKSILSLALVSTAIFISSCAKEGREVLLQEPLVDTSRDSISRYGEGFQLGLAGDESDITVFQYGSQSYQKLHFFAANSHFLNERPLVLLNPGGAWASYTEVAKLEELARFLNTKGFSAAIIEYALGPQNYDTYLTSMQDMKSAVRYMKLNHHSFKVDTANIFLGGWSSGSLVALTAAIMEQSEIAEVSNSILKGIIQDAVQRLGWENTDNLGVSSSVKGFVGMFTYGFEPKLIDAGDPAIMFINHNSAQLADGTAVIGSFNVGPINQYGTDLLVSRARTESYVDGQNLEYIRMTGASPYKGANEASLWSGNYPAIADFLTRNTQ